jgi:hypothetical protein
VNENSTLDDLLNQYFTPRPENTHILHQLQRFVECRDQLKLFLPVIPLPVERSPRFLKKKKKQQKTTKNNKKLQKTQKTTKKFSSTGESGCVLQVYSKFDIVSGIEWSDNYGISNFYCRDSS